MNRGAHEQPFEFGLYIFGLNLVHLLNEVLVKSNIIVLNIKRIKLE